MTDAGTAQNTPELTSTQKIQVRLAREWRERYAAPSRAGESSEQLHSRIAYECGAANVLIGDLLEIIDGLTGGAS